jgi:hypothetical protein
VTRGEGEGARLIAPFADSNAAVPEGGGDGQNIAPCGVKDANRRRPVSYHGSNVKNPL